MRLPFILSLVACEIPIRSFEGFCYVWSQATTRPRSVYESSDGHWSKFAACRCARSLFACFSGVSIRQRSDSLGGQTREEIQGRYYHQHRALPEPLQE